jgi:hypothetical protein
MELAREVVNSWLGWVLGVGFVLFVMVAILVVYMATRD